MTKFVFLVLPNIHLMDLAGPDQALKEAIDYNAPFEIEYCGINQDVKSTAGLQIKKQTHFSKVKFKPNDFLVIAGSSVDYLLSNDFKSNKVLLNWIKNLHQQQINIVSICAGAFVLGLAGVLDNVECTTHFKRTKQLQDLFPKAIVKEDILYTHSNNIYTSAGIASGIDLTLYIIEQLTDSYFAHKVARELVVYTRRDGEQKQQSVFLQFRNHVHTGIHLAQDFIVEHIDKKNDLFSLAEIACMSERNFTRIFKKETGLTVNQYINIIRRETILQLQKNPNLSKKQIAKKVGLDSERQIMRIVK